MVQASATDSTVLDSEVFCMKVPYKKMNLTLMACVLSLLANLSFAQEASENSDSHYSGAAIHVGEVGRNDGYHVYEGSLDLLHSAHLYGRMYGLGMGRLQLGNEVGVNVQGHLGFNVLGADSYGIIGLEPLNLSFNWTRRIATNAPLNYIEWQPMAAVGLQIPSDLCRVAILVRGGGSWGTIGENGLRPAYGMGGYINCSNVFDFAAEITHIQSDTPTDVLMSEIRIPLQHVGNVRLSLGLRAEALLVHGTGTQILIEKPVSGEHEEYRGFILVSAIPRRR